MTRNALFVLCLCSADALAIASRCQRSQVIMKAEWRSVMGKENADWQAALDSTLEQLWSAEMPRADLGVVFCPQCHSAALQEATAAAARHVSAKVFVGVVGAGVIGGGEELDLGQPAFSAMAGTLPEQTELRPFTMSGDALPVWSQIFQGDGRRPSFLVIADPFSPIAQATSCLDNAFPGAVVAGGLSCPTTDRMPSIALYQEGARCRTLPPGSLTGLGIRGPHIEMHTACAQGASGVGQAFTVTSGSGNLVRDLDGKPALEALEEVVEQAKSDARLLKLLRQGLMVGLRQSDAGTTRVGATDEDDFLVRQVIGSTVAGGILVGDPSVEAGRTQLRFHVRDEEAATMDLALLLSRYSLARQFSGRFTPPPGAGSPAPFAALLFACNGRGTRMFSTPNHDTKQFGEAVGEGVAVAGFACNGEIGPIGVSGLDSPDETRAVASPGASRTHLHGFTSVFAMLWDTTPSSSA